MNEKVTFAFVKPDWDTNWKRAFEPAKWSVVGKGETSGRNGKQKRPYLTLENEDGEQANVLIAMLVALQERENADVLLVDETKKGKTTTRRAVDGDEDCYLNPELAIGSNADGLFIA